MWYTSKDYGELIMEPTWFVVYCPTSKTISVVSVVLGDWELLTDITFPSNDYAWAWVVRNREYIMRSCGVIVGPLNNEEYYWCL